MGLPTEDKPPISCTTILQDIHNWVQQEISPEYLPIINEDNYVPQQVIIKCKSIKFASFEGYQHGIKAATCFAMKDIEGYREHFRMAMFHEYRAEKEWCESNKMPEEEKSFKESFCFSCGQEVDEYRRWR